MNLSLRRRGGGKLALFSAAFQAFALASVLAVSPTAPSRTEMSESVKPVPANAISQIPLTGTELSKPIEFMVALKMRNFADLQARIARGEIIPAAQMAAKYYPLQADYDNVVAWLKTQGFTIVKTDSTRIGVFASGPVDQVRQSFQVNFARVTANNREYVSAVSAPSVPAFIAPAVLGINGLQPHIQLRKHSRVLKQVHRDTSVNPAAVTPQSVNQPNEPPFLINEIKKAYGADTVTVNGAGQKIAVVIDTFPLTTDLTQFWAENSINQSLNNIEFIQVIPGGTYGPPSGEESLDVEWTSGIASGSKVRVYGASDLSFVNIDMAFAAIIADIPTQPQMHEVSISLGLGEELLDPTQIQTDAAYFASMAAQGLAIFVSSGDSGSEEGGFTEVSYFASDPSVTAVGGTSLTLRSCTGDVEAETAWDGSGGGISSFFARPSWQVGLGVPLGTTRLVPDISSAADPFTGALVIIDGDEFQIGGTSWSAPTWAGFGAMINQARANLTVPLPPVGNLAPMLYPLIGTTAFRDITSGSNGAYDAGIGYDLCTGLGVPSVATLIQPLTGGPTPPPAPTPSPTPVPTPPPAYATIQTPDMTCPLPSSIVTFSWEGSPGLATAYWLTIGKTQGGTEFFSSGQSAGQTFTVQNLPTDGRDIWVRLWSFVGGTWYNPPQDYKYEALPAFAQAPIIVPGTGSYKKKATVNMASGTPGATIYYTLNNTMPTSASTPFTKPFTVSKTTTVRAIAIKSGIPNSPVTAVGLTITKK